MICLDTNAVIAALNQPGGPLAGRIELAIGGKETVSVSTVVLFELWYGVANSARQQLNAQAIMEFLAGPISVLDLDADDAKEAGAVRAMLKRSGTPVGPYDVLIAAQARRRDALLVTANIRELSQVPGLRCEDWSRA
jgi:tRNA(fMet)-specific endonuclease VapC